MKRILSICLSFSLIFSLASCGKKTNDNNQVDQNTGTINNTVNIENNITDTNNSNNGVVSNFTYKMTLLNKSIADNKMETLWIAIETQSIDWKFMSSHMDQFMTIKNKTTGETILENGNIGNGYLLENFVLSACQDDHIKTRLTNKVSFSDHDFEILVLKLTYIQQLNPEDIEIAVSLKNNKTNPVTNLENVSVEFNCQSSDLDISNSCYHGNTLINVDGNYYILNTASVTSSGYTVPSLTKCSEWVVRPINGNIADFYNYFYGKLILVNSDSLEPIALRTSSTLYMEYKESDYGDRIRVGLTFENEPASDSGDINTLKNASVAYVNDNGETVVLFWGVTILG